MIPVMSSMMLLLIKVEKNRMMPITTIEPMNAPMTIEKNPERVIPAVAMVPPPKSMTMATPKLAPELMPRMEGPANGLLKAVCSMSPEPASAAPHSKAVKAWGIRFSQTMKLQLAFSASPPKRVRITASAGMSTEPKNRLPAINIRIRAVSARLYVVPLLFIVLCFTTDFFTNYSANLLKYFNSYSGKRLGWKIFIKSFKTLSGWKGKSS